MRIICPDCAAQYELPPELAARLPMRVRCARCGDEWLAEPVGLVPDAAAPALERDAGPAAGDISSERSGAVAVEPIDPNIDTVEPGGGMEPAAPVEPGAGERVARPIDPVDEAARPSPMARAGGTSGAGRGAMVARRSDRNWWIASVVVLLGLIALFLGLHHAIGAAWPASLRLYRALGLA
jgi:predicted Zn finger-like uncharacterized protein